jgi:hypothetical protein
MVIERASAEVELVAVASGMAGLSRFQIHRKREVRYEKVVAQSQTRRKHPVTQRHRKGCWLQIRVVRKTSQMTMGPAWRLAKVRP